MGNKTPEEIKKRYDNKLEYYFFFFDRYPLLLITFCTSNIKIH